MPSAAARPWLFYALTTTVLFGIWGALIELPDKAGFPATLGYVVWALTMVPCALVALRNAGWRLDRHGRAVGLSALAGLLGAGGQLLLFLALRQGPAYLVFPIISLYPVVTVVLSVLLLRESAGRKSWLGIVLAIPAMALLSYQPAGGSVAGAGWWLPLTLVVFLAWGWQAYLMKFANESISAETIFFLMMATGVSLIPVALWMTDWGQRIEWGWRGPGAAAMIQALNAIGALTLVYALRYGKAIIVVPMTALAPVLTVLLSLALYRTVPHPLVVAGMVLAAFAIYLMAE